MSFLKKFFGKNKEEQINASSVQEEKLEQELLVEDEVLEEKEKAEEVREKLGNDQYTTLAYMPTWRGKSNHDVDTAQYSKEVNKLLTYLSYPPASLNPFSLTGKKL